MPLSIDEIVQELESAARVAGQEEGEPLAAHTLLPLMKELALFVRANPAGAAPMLPEPQIAQLSLSLVAELRTYLQGVAFEGLLGPYEEEEHNIEGRKIFLALESELSRIPMELVADQWMTWVEQQQAEMAGAEEDDDEQTDESGAMQNTPTQPQPQPSTPAPLGSQPPKQGNQVIPMPQPQPKPTTTPTPPVEAIQNPLQVLPLPDPAQLQQIVETPEPPATEPPPPKAEEAPKPEAKEEPTQE